MNDVLLLLFVALFGAIIGSFLNVLIYRLPRGLDFVTPRSACPHCQRKIPWYENIPLFSYLILFGKCKNCGQRISSRYLLVEIIMAAAAIALFPTYLELNDLIFYIYFLALFSAFVVHFFIDLEHHLLLDQINLYLVLLILPYAIFFLPWRMWVFGALVGFGGTYVVTWIFYLIRGKIGLGGGDIKLFGILGLWLGPQGVVENIFLSCLLGSVVGLFLMGLKKMNRDQHLPFGPFILIAATFQIFFPRVYNDFSALLGFS